MTISPHFCKWLHGHSWYLSLLSSTYSIFPLPLASSSVLCGSLPAEMTQTFILEGSRPLVVLPELAYNFDLNHRD